MHDKAPGDRASQGPEALAPGANPGLLLSNLKTRSIKMRNIKLTLAYDGTDFSGWQVQPGQSTIQGALVDVVERLTQYRSMLQGAGRTDAGVHAAGQVANFKTESSLSAGEFQRALNALLPP